MDQELERLIGRTLAAGITGEETLQVLEHHQLHPSEKRPVFLKENGGPRKAPRRAPLSRLAAGHRESGAGRP